VESLATGLELRRWPLSAGQSMPLRPGSRTGPLPVSFVQERLWFLDQLVPQSDAYNVPAALRLTGGLKIPALAKPPNEIVRRHEALRTTFRFQNGALTQVIAPSLQLRISQQDVSTVPLESRQIRAREVASATARQPFDLARGPLVRAAVVRLAAEEH